MKFFNVNFHFFESKINTWKHEIIISFFATSSRLSDLTSQTKIILFRNSKIKDDKKNGYFVEMEAKIQKKYEFDDVCLRWTQKPFTASGFSADEILWLNKSKRNYDEINDRNARKHSRFERCSMHRNEDEVCRIRKLPWSTYKHLPSTSKFTRKFVGRTNKSFRKSFGEK